VAETKGTTENNNLRLIEQDKINCAKKLFKALSNGHVTYEHVDTYETLLKRAMGQSNA
jgi:type III restriction enzyme